MKKRTLVAFVSISLMLLSSIEMKGQELVKAPKQYSLELGYRYSISNDLLPSGGSHGYGFMLDYAWQLSGFSGSKRPVYLSVPIGYTIIPGSGAVSGQRMLSYGWTVRHMMNKDKTFQPFLGYALLLNQFSIDDRDGSLFGHQTRFDLGLNYRTESAITPFIKMEYSMARHPQLDNPESNWLHFIEIKAGIRLK